jgi:hypothetical protein
MWPIRFLVWVLGIAFTIGIGDAFVHLTYEMAKAAADAHVHDQISYSKYTKLLWSKSNAKNKDSRSKRE